MSDQQSIITARSSLDNNQGEPSTNGTGSSERIICPQCYRPNIPGSKFCTYCNFPLEKQPITGWICPKCKTMNKIGTNYCINCESKPISRNLGLLKLDEIKTAGIFVTIAGAMMILGFLLPWISFTSTGSLSNILSLIGMGSLSSNVSFSGINLLVYSIIAFFVGGQDLCSGSSCLLYVFLLIIFTLLLFFWVIFGIYFLRFGIRLLKNTEMDISLRKTKSKKLIHRGIIIAIPLVIYILFSSIFPSNMNIGILGMSFFSSGFWFTLIGAVLIFISGAILDN